MILACVYFFIRIAILIKNYAKLRIVTTSQKYHLFKFYFKNNNIIHKKNEIFKTFC